MLYVGKGYNVALLMMNMEKWAKCFQLYSVIEGSFLESFHISYMEKGKLFTWNAYLRVAYRYIKISSQIIATTGKLQV